MQAGSFFIWAARGLGENRPSLIRVPGSGRTQTVRGGRRRRVGCATPESSHLDHQTESGRNSRSGLFSFLDTDARVLSLTLPQPRILQFLLIL